MRLPALIPLLALVCLLTPACSDDPDPAPKPPFTTRIHVRDAEGDLPVAGVKVVAMATATNTPLAGPLLSDEDGICDFGEDLTEAWALLAFGGGKWRVFGATAATPASGATGLLAPAIAPYPVRPVIRVTPIPAPGGVHISGILIDSATYEPLGQVFIASQPYPTGYVEGTGPGDDVTMTDGAFRVSEVIFAQVPGTMNMFQVVPLFITREGYVPRAWRYEPRPGEYIGEISGVEILLQKDDGLPRGSLSGRLLRLDEPAPGVIVGLGTAAIINQKGGPGMPGWTAVSGADGVFSFEDLPVGRYVLHPGFLPQDGTFFPNQPGNVPREVTAGAETDVGDLFVVWEMEALDPPSGARVPAETREFRWTEAPGATTYQFARDGLDPIMVDEPLYVIPGDLPLRAGRHFWSVIALDSEGGATGTFGATAEFHVTVDEVR